MPFWLKLLPFSENELSKMEGLFKIMGEVHYLPASVVQVITLFQHWSSPEHLPPLELKDLTKASGTLYMGTTLDISKLPSLYAAGCSRTCETSCTTTKSCSRTCETSCTTTKSCSRTCETSCTDKTTLELWDPIPFLRCGVHGKHGIELTSTCWPDASGCLFEPFSIDDSFIV